MPPGGRRAARANQGDRAAAGVAAARRAPRWRRSMVGSAAALQAAHHLVRPLAPPAVPRRRALPAAPPFAVATPTSGAAARGRDTPSGGRRSRTPGSAVPAPRSCSRTDPGRPPRTGRGRAFISSLAAAAKRLGDTASAPSRDLAARRESGGRRPVSEDLAGYTGDPERLEEAAVPLIAHEAIAILTLLLSLVSAIGVLWIALRLERVAARR